MAQVILEQEERLEETLIKSLSVICPGTNHTLIFLLVTLAQKLERVQGGSFLLLTQSCEAHQYKED